MVVVATSLSLKIAGQNPHYLVAILLVSAIFWLMSKNKIVPFIVFELLVYVL